MENFFIPCRLVSVSIQGWRQDCTIQWYWHGLIWKKSPCKRTSRTTSTPFLWQKLQEGQSPYSCVWANTLLQVNMISVHLENHNFSRFLGLSGFHLSFQTFMGAKLQEGPNSKLQVNTTHTYYTHDCKQHRAKTSKPTLILEDLVSVDWLTVVGVFQRFCPVPVAFSAGSVLVNNFRISSQPFTPSASWVGKTTECLWINLYNA